MCTGGRVQDKSVRSRQKPKQTKIIHYSRNNKTVFRKGKDTKVQEGLRCLSSVQGHDKVDTEHRVKTLGGQRRESVCHGDGRHPCK